MKAPKKARPERTGHVWWIERDGHIWLEQRDARRMLGGMRGLPGTRWDSRDAQDSGPPLSGDWRRMSGTVVHVFTHFALRLHIWRIELDVDTPLPGDGQWWPIAELDNAGLPTLFAKVARAVSEETA